MGSPTWKRAAAEEDSLPVGRPLIAGGLGMSENKASSDGEEQPANISPASNNPQTGNPRASNVQNNFITRILVKNRPRNQYFCLMPPPPASSGASLSRAGAGCSSSPREA